MIKEPASINSLRELIKTAKSVYNYRLDYYAQTSLSLGLEKYVIKGKYGSIDKLLDLLAKKDESLFNDLLTTIQVCNKELFRSPSLWRTLKEDKIITNISGRNYQIWLPNAGNGAELYTLLIHLNELQLQNKVNITVTAQNDSILKSIKDGELDQKTIQLGIDNYNRYKGEKTLESYLSIKEGEKYFNTTYLKGINYKIDNIFESKNIKHFDLIFFRNRMLIYNTLGNKAIQNVINGLKPGGILIIGEKETLDNKEYKVKELSNKESIYKKA